MTASALLLHRMLMSGAGRGLKAPPTTPGDPGAELTQTHPLGIVTRPQNTQQSQIVNADSAANLGPGESPHYSTTEQRTPPHA